MDTGRRQKSGISPLFAAVPSGSPPPRSTWGVPGVCHVCEEAEYFFHRMAELDAQISRKVKEIRDEHARNVNSHRRSSMGYQVGDMVWLAKPKTLQGQKISTYWVGPYKIKGQVGGASFLLDIGGMDYAVHEDQLKRYVDSPMDPQGVPLYHHPARSLACKVEEIRHHRQEGLKWQFLVHWEGSLASQDSWVDMIDLLQENPRIWVEYFRRNGLFPELVHQYSTRISNLGEISTRIANHA